MIWTDEKDAPIWVVYSTNYGSRFTLTATTISVWEAMVELKSDLADRLVAKNVTYETANKMIGLTKG